MEININSNTQQRVLIECGASTSCSDITINITGNARSNITCYDLNACISMEIIIDSDNYKNTLLNMYSFSDDILFFNGFGYGETDGSQQYITCNTESQFIQYPTNLSLQTTQALTPSVLNEYQGQKFPCDGIQIECFEDENSTSTSSCDMTHSIGTTGFNIPSPDQSAPCYWVSVTNLVQVSCSGNCASSPTKDPTPSPTNAPSTPTEIPTTQPTIDPTSDPTKDPTLEPTIDPTQDPTIDPTIDPTTDPTKDPTFDPTLNPTSDPTIDPTTDPTIDPTNDPTADPTIDPTKSSLFF